MKFKKVLSSIFVPCINTIEIMSSNDDDDDRIDCSKHPENAPITNDRLTESKLVLHFENEQNSKNCGNVFTETNMAAKCNFNIKSIKDGYKVRKSRKKHKLFLFSDSCKRLMKNNSFDNIDVVLNQEQFSDMKFVTKSLVIDGANIKTLASASENVTNKVIADEQSSRSLFCSENINQAETKTVTEDFNSNLDQIPLTLSSGSEAKDGKLCEINANHQINSEVKRGFLFDELPFVCCSAPQIIAPDKRKMKKRKHSYHKKTLNGRKRPNYFIAIQVSDPQICYIVKKVQQYIVHRQPHLKSALVKPCTLHVTLLLCHISNFAELRRACRALEESFPLLKERLLTNPLNMIFKGVGNFNDKVLFAELKEDNTIQMLNDISYHVRNCYERYGLKLSGKKSLVPHLTLLKLSKDPALWEKGIRKIDPSLYEECKNAMFGVQPVQRLQLLSMLKCKHANGYYHCEKELLFCTPNQSTDNLKPRKSYSMELKTLLKKQKEAIKKQIASLTFKQLELFQNNE